MTGTGVLSGIHLCWSCTKCVNGQGWRGTGRYVDDCTVVSAMPPEAHGDFQHRQGAGKLR